MKEKSDKSHLMMSCSGATTALMDDLPIDFGKADVLLRITINHEMKLDNHVNNLCKTSRLKLNALARITHFMILSKKRIIMKSFIELQFGCCLPI